MKQMIQKIQHTLKGLSLIKVILMSVLTGGVSSCIEPPLNLPAEELIVDMPLVIVDLDIVWDLDIDWQTRWHYKWDAVDQDLWGEIGYPTPTNYEVRRYYLGKEPHQPHTTVDPFTIWGSSFRRAYQFGYYDLLVWSNIDSKDGTQVVLINEKNLDEVTATTSISRGMSRVVTKASLSGSSTRAQMLYGSTRKDSTSTVTGLYNQPEVFYSTYPQDIYISQNKNDYDYYDEVNKCYVKRINCELTPLVYIYLVQVIIRNNNGKIIGCSGDNAISNFASSTSVNTGHTGQKPSMIYYGSRYKSGVTISRNDTILLYNECKDLAPAILHEGEVVDIIGGRLTTYGLCDMPSYAATKSSSEYNGTRTDLENFLYVDLNFNNGATGTLEINVTEQCRKQAHGGIITIILDANDITPPKPDPGPDQGSGSLFVPTVEDYDEIVYDIII